MLIVRYVFSYVSFPQRQRFIYLSKPPIISFFFIKMYTLEPVITRGHDFRIHTLCVVTALVRSLSGCLSVVFLDVTVQLAAYTVGQPGERNRTVCFAEGSCRS
jgi:hypothetical protein